MDLQINDQILKLPVFFFPLSGILDVEKLPPSNKEIEDIVSYSWNIDTKYYTAEIKLCTTKKRTVGTEEFADGVEAIVIYFNASQVS